VIHDAFMAQHHHREYGTVPESDSVNAQASPRPDPHVQDKMIHMCNNHSLGVRVIILTHPQTCQLTNITYDSDTQDVQLEVDSHLKILDRSDSFT
jgi:hypothetical protein